MFARNLLAALLALPFSSPKSYAICCTWLVTLLTALPFAAQGQAFYSDYHFITLAGIADGVDGIGVDGFGTAARFNSPEGVALDTAGNLYVTDPSECTVRKVTALGMVTTPLGTQGIRGSADGIGPVARFNQPIGVAVDSHGCLYITDYSNHTLRKVSPDQTVTTLAGLSLYSPTNRFPPGGYVDGVGSNARFNLPRGIAVDRTGFVYVAEEGNSTIRKVSPAGEVTTLAGLAGVRGSADGTGSTARFNGPRALALDSEGNIYVADGSNHTIRRVTPGGTVSTLAGSAGISGSSDGVRANARFNVPSGLAVDASGHIFVTDRWNHTIRRVTPAGVVVTLAGLAGNHGSADGVAPSARFYGPNGLALDSKGCLYVVDQANHTIRRGCPPPKILGPYVTSWTGFAFDISGASGTAVVVEVSTNLTYWLPIATNTLTGSDRYSDPQTQLFPKRYYRLRAILP
jgi:sugar lactone lactonase YvrE